VADIRTEFAQWLRDHLVVSPERLSDIVLAVNEALANSAEYAYRSCEEVGTVSIEATHDSTTASLTVVMTDRGSWNDDNSDPRSHTRGRGIPLMYALSDSAVIQRLSDGTEVRLRFDDCPAGANRSDALTEA